jgi:hypothetical protein
MYFGYMPTRLWNPRPAADLFMALMSLCLARAMMNRPPKKKSEPEPEREYWCPHCGGDHECCYSLTTALDKLQSEQGPRCELAAKCPFYRES